MISGCAPIANVRASFGADVADEYSKMLDAVKAYYLCSRGGGTIEAAKCSEQRT